MNKEMTEGQGDAEAALEELARDPRVRKMKHYIQHGKITTYDHCLSVARMSCRINEKLHLNARKKALVRGAVLHDYYLYDWHTHGDHLHGYHHPHIASAKAAKDFGLSEHEQSIIRTHMWPLTLFHVPTSREAVIVCIADKVCSTRETLFER